MTESRPDRQFAAEQVATQAARKPVPAYLLCIFLGTLGLHRFYLHRKGSGLAMLLITLLLGWALGLGLAITLVWCIVDLFLIPGIIDKENQRIRIEAYGRFGIAPIMQVPPPPELERGQEGGS
jgi:TM2 domain-containing membrane protein YozV